MPTRRVISLAVGVIVVFAVAAWAVQQTGREPTRDQPHYRVVPWPANTADQPYHEHVERYLNQMAEQGWAFHGDVVGQGAKMMVFERRPSR